jgi:hypothetical protein
MWLPFLEPQTQVVVAVVLRGLLQVQEAPVLSSSK